MNNYTINSSIFQTGKGDLVGCDMNAYLQAHNGAGSAPNTDVVVKSSCDVKVLFSTLNAFTLFVSSI